MRRDEILSALAALGAELAEHGLIADLWLRSDLDVRLAAALIVDRYERLTAPRAETVVPCCKHPHRGSRSGRTT
ncbi:MAG: hypothetical protein ACRDTA_05815, partial [Pseudonocardiaceae bacterium]